jgi:hypothetical protein
MVSWIMATVRPALSMGATATVRPISPEGAAEKPPPEDMFSGTVRFRPCAEGLQFGHCALMEAS